MGIFHQFDLKNQAPNLEVINNIYSFEVVARISEAQLQLSENVYQNLDRPLFPRI